MHPAAELFPLPTRQAVVASGATFPGGRQFALVDNGVVLECVVVCLFRHLGLPHAGWMPWRAVHDLQVAGMPLPAGWSTTRAAHALWDLMRFNDGGHLGTRQAVAAALGVPLPQADPEAAAAVAAAEALVADRARESAGVA